MALATLSVDLVAHLARFEGDMKKAAVASEQASRDIVSSIGTVKAAVGGLAAGFTFAAIIDMGKAAINSVDALNDLKDATGASIENISALEDVAARTGTNFETVQASLIKFNAALKDAKPGSDQEAAFKALNLNVKELQALDPAEALLRTSQALAGFADDGNKARLMQELFGKSLKEVAPFLKDLAEKGKLVATVTSEQAEQAERFNKQLFELQKNSQDAARRITGDLVPALSEVLALYSKQGLGAAIDGIGNKLFDWEGSASRKLIANIKADLADLKEQSGLVSVDLFGSKGKLAQEIEAKTAELAAAEAAYYKLTNGQAGAGRGSINPAAVDARTSVRQHFKPAGKNVDQDYEAYLKRLDDQITKTVQLSTAEQLLFDIENRRVTLTPQQKEELQLRAEIIDKMKAEELAVKTLDAAKKSADQYLSGLAKETTDMKENNKKLAEHVEEIGKTTVGLNALTLARMDTAIAAAEQARAQLNLQNSSEAEIAVIERKIELLKEQRALTAKGQIAQTSKDFSDTLHNDLKGAFSAAFRDAGGDPLKAFGDALENMIFTRAATALSDAAMEAAAGAFASSSSGSSGSGGGVVDLFKSLFSFDGGGFTGTGSRSGGLDGKGGFMAMLHPNETVLDHTKGQSAGGGGITVVQHISIDSRSDQATIMAAMQRTKAETLSAIQQSRRAGGVFA